LKKRTLVVLTGPSAVGKSYTAQKLVRMFPDDFAYACVHTTRPKRVVENRSDERVFVSDDEFRAMIADDMFFLYEDFANYLYGYSHSSLSPSDKHLLVDVSPCFLPKFADRGNTLVIGLQPPSDFAELLEKRMLGRGDSSKIRAARHPFIRRDIQDLEKMEPFVNQRGKLFRIQDNRTIPEQVIPWAVRHLGLLPRSP